jgi:hypothetical protein
MGRWCVMAFWRGLLDANAGTYTNTELHLISRPGKQKVKLQTIVMEVINPSLDFATGGSTTPSVLIAIQSDLAPVGTERFVDEPELIYKYEFIMRTMAWDATAGFFLGTMDYIVFDNFKDRYVYSNPLILASGVRHTTEVAIKLEYEVVEMSEAEAARKALEMM